MPIILPIERQQLEYEGVSMVKEDKFVGGGEIKLPIAVRSLAYLQGYSAAACRSLALSYIRAPLPIRGLEGR